MISRRTDRRRTAFAGVALLALAVLASGCGRPDDEAWLRFLGFRASGETAPLSVLNGDLADGTDLTVDVEFQNASLFVGQKVGLGIEVNRARIDYRMSGFSPPAAEYPLSLYLPPPADGNPTTGTLTMFPLAPVSLQQWLIDAGVSDPVVELTARVTFYGVTDDGASVETEGSIRIALINTDGGGGAPPATKPTLNVKTLINGKQSTLLAGKFRVESTVKPSSNLTVVFTLAAGPGILVSGIDYVQIGTSVVIYANQYYADISITPISGGNTGSVTITLANNNDAYAIDSTYKTDTLMIE